MWMLEHFVLSLGTFRLSSLFSLYSILQYWFIPFCLPGHLSTPLPQLFCCWFLLVYYPSVCLFITSFSFLVNISWILAILFLRSWVTAISLAWILFWEGCLPPLHLIVFLGFYLVFFFWEIILCFFISIKFLWLWLSFWRLQDSNSYFCLPSGAWSGWEKLNLVLEGSVMLSKTLIQISVYGWGCASSLWVWPEATQPWSLGWVYRLLFSR